MTYASHELEDTGLGLVEQSSYLIQAGNHLRVFTNGAGHATGKSVAKVVVNVELTGRTRCKEGIVQAWKS